MVVFGVPGTVDRGYLLYPYAWEGAEVASRTQIERGAWGLDELEGQQALFGHRRRGKGQGAGKTNGGAV